jgi:hypothetical protein
MLVYKRNQVESAIALMFQRASGEGADTELRTRLKRLLETDRALGHNSRSSNPEKSNFAFFSEGSPGTGADVWFSAYEAFALLTAWRLLEHGWPQASAVAVLRRARPTLEPEHTRILKLNPREIFDAKSVQELARPGALAVETANPVFLVISSMDINPREADPDARSIEIYRSEEELMPALRRQAGLSSTIYEIVGTAHVLHARLEQTEPSKRGRGSRR